MLANDTFMWLREKEKLKIKKRRMDCWLTIRLCGSEKSKN